MISALYNQIVIPGEMMNRNWETALAWLKSDSWKNVPIGRTEIDGSGVYVLRSSYLSKKQSECLYESHRLYADIQMTIKGTELLLACRRDGLIIAEPYSAEKDIDFLRGEPAPIHRVILGFPLAAVLFPWDVHMPALIANGNPEQVEKLVVKIAL